MGIGKEHSHPLLTLFLPTFWVDRGGGGRIDITDYYTGGWWHGGS